MQVNNQANTSGCELESRSQGLQDAEANYWAIVDDPQATEADRVEAAEMLEEAETRVRELTTVPVVGETAAESSAVRPEQELEAEF